MSRLLLLLIWVGCFTLATCLEPLFSTLKNNSANASLAALLMGESRQMFAKSFTAKADAYFHSGNYPTIFDTPAKKTESAADHEGDDHHDEDAHVKAFLPGASRDWIERFGRNFLYKGHSHLENGEEREMLPWLRLAADMDPHEISVYMTTAYWLRDRLHKPAEAEQFLREGLSANPDSYELYDELGVTLLVSHNDRAKARRLWLIARSKWRAADVAGTKPDPFALERILGHLVQLEKAEGNTAGQIAWLEELKKISPVPEAIDMLLQQAHASAGAPDAAPPEKKP